MRGLLLAVSVMFSLSNCNHSAMDCANNIEGEWFYVDKKDSSYNELYFNQSLHFYNLNSAGVGPIFNYEIVRDSLFISRDNFKRHRVFLLKFISKVEDNLLIINSNSDTIKLEPLRLQGGVFYDLHTGNRAREALTKGRLTRGSNTLMKRKLFKKKIKEYKIRLFLFQSQR